MITDEGLQDLVEAGGMLPDDLDTADLADALCELAARRNASRWRSLKHEPPPLDGSLVVIRMSSGCAPALTDLHIRSAIVLGYEEWRLLEIAP